MSERAKELEEAISSQLQAEGNIGKSDEELISEVMTGSSSSSDEKVVS